MKKLLLLSLLLISSGPAFGLDVTSEGIYNATKEVCSTITPADIQNPSKKLIQEVVTEKYAASPAFNEILMAIRRGSLKDFNTNYSVSQKTIYAEHLLQSDAFAKALRDCYPDSPESREFFYAIVRKSDLTGKTWGVSIFAASLWAGGRVIAGVSTLLLRLSGVAYKTFSIAQQGATLLLITSNLTSDSQTRKSNEGTAAEKDLKNLTSNSYGMSEEKYALASQALIDFNNQKIAQYNSALTKETDPLKRKHLEKKISETQNLIRELQALQ